MRTLRIGTRGSPLALWQAHAVERAILQSGGPPCESVTIKTTGDRLVARSLSTIGGKRLFVKEIEEALLTGAVDLAVHSAKDLPGDLPPGLAITAALPREDPRDALVLAWHDGDSGNGGETARLLSTLGPTPRIGTGSVRRIAQLARVFPDAVFESIRGNVGTRLRKLDAGDYDVLVMARAGLVRLGLASRISATLSMDECVPAPGQGIVAIETRAADRSTASVLAEVGDLDAMLALEAERSVVKTLEGDCRVPVGAIAILETDGLTLDVIVASLDGTQVLRRQIQGPRHSASALGKKLARQLLHDGAAEVLAPHRP